jgi:hypothetical protein
MSITTQGQDHGKGHVPSSPSHPPLIPLSSPSHHPREENRHAFKTMKRSLRPFRTKLANGYSACDELSLAIAS